MVGPLHDRLGSCELHVAAEPLCKRKIGTTREQESEFRCAELLIELGIAATGYIELKGIGRLFDYFVLQGATRSELLEGCGKFLVELVRTLCLPVCLTILPI